VREEEMRKVRRVQEGEQRDGKVRINIGLPHLIKVARSKARVRVESKPRISVRVGSRARIRVRVSLTHHGSVLLPGRK
jgi:predicted SPOUT superfamily RNA methylase MTH1